MPGRTYTAEFKRDAVALTERDGVPKAAQALGIKENILYRWRREASQDVAEAFRGKGVMKTDLVLDALNRAIADRRPSSGLLFHSDRGVQYASDAFRARLKQVGIRQSMSRKGNCWDNACIESFFGSMKQEGCGILFKSRQEARLCIFDYIAGFYNPQRLHSTLGYLSPDQFERRVA